MFKGHVTRYKFSLRPILAQLTIVSHQWSATTAWMEPPLPPSQSVGDSDSWQVGIRQVNDYLQAHPASVSDTRQGIQKACAPGNLEDRNDGSREGVAVTEGGPGVGSSKSRHIWLPHKVPSLKGFAVPTNSGELGGQSSCSLQPQTSWH